MTVNVTGGAMSPEEKKIYIDYIQTKFPGRKFESINIVIDGEYVDLAWELTPAPFERIRRITGYLVGDKSRWNNAKSAEEEDRVKHTLVDPKEGS